MTTNIPRLVKLFCLLTLAFFNVSFAQNTQIQHVNFHGANQDPVDPTRNTQDGFDRENRGDSNDKKWIIPAIAIGAVAVAAIQSTMAKAPEPDSPEATEPQNRELENQLHHHGPKFSHLYNMSAFMIMGFVKGGWPLVIDFEHPEPGYVELMVRTKTSDTFRYRLDGGETGHRHIVLPLPSNLGDEPVPALIAVTATTAKNSDKTLAGFRLLGLGAGPRSVGSVAVDKVTIATDKIQSSLGQTAAYSFYSHSTFEHAAVDFMKVIDDYDGEKHEWINKYSLSDGVKADQWVGEEERLDWDGHDSKSRPSLGAHKLQVRVWHNQGDWVSAWSNSALFVVK